MTEADTAGQTRSIMSGMDASFRDLPLDSREVFAPDRVVNAICEVNGSLLI